MDKKSSFSILESFEEILEGAKIEVEHEGLLEVPKGKKFYDLPMSHYEKLVGEKGYEKVIRGLANLEVWNKNDDPSIADKANKIAEALKRKFRPNED